MARESTPAPRIHRELRTDKVRIGPTRVGKGVFALRGYPALSIIGEITGKVVADPDYGTEYSYDFGDGYQLEPAPPFRYVNHSCDPNCEFDWHDADESAPIQQRLLYLIGLRDIAAGEEFTIDYGWPARFAIPCDCRSPLCRGWVVAAEEIGRVPKPEEPWPLKVRTW